MGTVWRKSSRSNFSGNCVEASAVWRKSSYSHANGSCLEAAAVFRSSAYCQSGECVEVAAGGCVLVRDSKDPAGAVLAFNRAEWQAFTSALKRVAP